MNVETQIRLAERALTEARQALGDGRLVDARRALRLAANEADDAQVSLNIKIAEDS